MKVVRTMHFLILSYLLMVKPFCNAQPNVVIFLVDDLGIGDVGCFGNDTIKTPNIDKLATEGARLTHNLSPESVCTPSRAAFLTGRYAIRSGLAANPGRNRMFLFLSVPGGLPQNETTFAEVLQDAGYATERLHRAKPRQMSKKEIKEMNLRLYNNLPEVKAQKAEDRRTAFYKTNRLRAKLYDKRVRENLKKRYAA